jgi:hypothetical protein
MEYIYHYTSRNHLAKILESGVLEVSSSDKKDKIKPAALWLSTNPVWEHTATKQAGIDGKIVQLTKQQQHEKIGLIRFVLEFKKESLCSWAKYKYKSNISLQLYNGMEAAGISMGANPKEWYACFHDIPLNKCISCEEWDGKNWVVVIDYIEGWFDAEKFKFVKL